MDFSTAVALLFAPALARRLLVEAGLAESEIRNQKSEIRL
eukprot:COSAG02_NODE_179_length_31090_cov_49.813785_30_plen_40_part_00